MKRSAPTALVATLLFLVTFPLAADDEIKFEKGKKVRVMTVNLYVGANLFRLLTPEEGNPFCDPDVTPLCVPATVDGILATVLETDFEERAEKLAKQIKENKPDLIGLQEVALYRTQSPSDFLDDDSPNAEDVLLDFLEILLDKLDAEGAHYEIAVEGERLDIELPRLVGFDGPIPLLDDARLTDRDVILVKKNVETSNESDVNFDAQLPLSVAGSTVFTIRGFVAVDAKVRGVTYRFVNTHIENQEDTLGGFFQREQTDELIDLLADEDLPVILLGDFNSSPDDPMTQPYEQLRAAGYVDMWRRRDVPDAGLTCCQDEDLQNEDSVLSERVDHIFVRNDLGFLPFSSVGPVKEIKLVGPDEDSEPDSGLWTSDHAGVFAELRIPRLTEAD